MGQDLEKVENVYDVVAEQYTETFSAEHEKKPKDQEILHRFSQEIGDRKPVWDFGCGPGQTAKYLKNLGIEISGLDLSTQVRGQSTSKSFSGKKSVSISCSLLQVSFPVL